MENNNTEQVQSRSTLGGPSPWTEHLLGQARPATPTRSAGVLLATSGTTIASPLVRLQISSATRAPQAPTAPLEEPATASATQTKRAPYY